MTFRRKLRSPLFACTFAACAVCTAAFADAPDASVEADAPGSRMLFRPQSVDAAPIPLPPHRAGERGPLLRPEGAQRAKPAAAPVAAPSPAPEKKKGLFGCSAAPSASASGALGLLGVVVWAAARARRRH